LVWFKFRHQIPTRVRVPSIEPKKCLKDKPGAIYGSICLLVCLGLLLGADWFPSVPMWAITLGVAGLMLAKDIYRDIITKPPLINTTVQQDNIETNEVLLDENSPMDPKQQSAEAIILP